MNPKKLTSDQLQRTLHRQRRMHEVLETSDVARLMLCSPDMVRYLARTGRLPEHRLPSGRRLFQLDDVRRVARERGVTINT